MKHHPNDAYIAELTRAGWSLPKIAAELGVSPRTVSRARVRLGIANPPPHRLTREEIATATAMLDDGCSRLEVERTLGLKPQALQRRFASRGWSHQEISEFGNFCSRMARKQRAAAR